MPTTLAELVLRDEAPSPSPSSSSSLLSAGGIVRSSVVGAPVLVGAAGAQRTPVYTTYTAAAASASSSAAAAAAVAGRGGASRTVTYRSYRGGLATDPVSYVLPLAPISPARAAASVPAPEAAAFEVPALGSPGRAGGAAGPISPGSARRGLLLRSRVSSEADTLGFGGCGGVGGGCGSGGGGGSGGGSGSGGAKGGAAPAP
jgi:hypothetical protein